jgi:hypothetical protein
MSKSKTNGKSTGTGTATRASSTTRRRVYTSPDWHSFRVRRIPIAVWKRIAANAAREDVSVRAFIIGRLERVK